MFGHKVVFLNPVFGGHGEVFKQLVEDEYELYRIENYRDAKSVLREFKDSICFAHAEGNLEKRKMINFILSCSKDGSLSTTIFYLIASELSSKEKKVLEGAGSCYAGMITLNPRTAFMIQDIERNLEEKNAKGRRQFVRISCADDKQATALAELGERIYKFKMHDISIMGSACVVEGKFAAVFEKGTVIQNVNFALGGKTIAVSKVVVYGVFPAGADVKLVLLFSEALKGENKDFVHKYIVTSFENDVDAIIKTHPRDQEDYSKDFDKSADADEQ